MRKPSIALPPTPAVAAADAFVLAGEPIRDELKSKVEMKRLTIDVPSDLHRAFKSRAVGNETDMRELMLEWISAYVARTP